MGTEETQRATLEEVRELRAEVRELAEELKGRMDSEVLKFSEAAAAIGCSTRWLQGEIKSGKLKAHRVGRELRIRRDDLEAYLERVKAS
ncbi:MAG: helix-turn-helix domain-containing protein [Myxococcota bacterium]